MEPFAAAQPEQYDQTEQYEARARRVARRRAEGVASRHQAEMDQLLVAGIQRLVRTECRRVGLVAEMDDIAAAAVAFSRWGVGQDVGRDGARQARANSAWVLATRDEASVDVAIRGWWRDRRIWPHDPGSWTRKLIRTTLGGQLGLSRTEYETRGAMLALAQAGRQITPELVAAELGRREQSAAPSQAKISRVLHSVTGGQSGGDVVVEDTTMARLRAVLADLDDDDAVTARRAANKAAEARTEHAVAVLDRLRGRLS
ncbi:MAG: hypothetical protein ACYCS4_11070 [Acidimicrobiales bacterium]